MGKVYLVGAGPGDPSLITCKGMELLKQCDVVIYDSLASNQLLQHVSEQCVKLYVGKRSGQHSKTQDEINQIIVEQAKQKDCVVRLKGGDPFVFGRGGEEIEELKKQHIPYEVVPGVTSAISVPASAGIPVTHRGVSQSFHVITGHTKSSDNTLTDNYEVLAKLDGTLVFLMGLSNLEQIIQQLLTYGKSSNTPAAVISNGTMNNQKVVRGILLDIVEKVREEKITSPAIIVIGETAALAYAEVFKLPLSHISIGLVGTKAIRTKLEKGLINLGASVFTVCNMQLETTPKIHELEQEIKVLEQYQWIIFTSQNAINLFFDYMNERRIDQRKLGNIKFATIGSGTKQVLEQYGYYADFVPSRYNTIDLATEFTKFANKNERILIPRAVRGSEELTRIFHDNQLNYKELGIYDVKGKLVEEIEVIRDMNCLVFASASGVDEFFDQIKESKISIPDHMKIACIGDMTVEALHARNQGVDIIANVSNVEGLIEAIGNYKWV